MHGRTEMGFKSLSPEQNLKNDRNTPAVAVPAIQPPRVWKTSTPLDKSVYRQNGLEHVD